MATEPERYLRKARESLASAQADVRAKRYNSAANRAYYAAFQAAVAALIDNDVRPGENWEHEFVASQFSGKLIWRRKLIKAEFRNVLERLFEVRVDADYRPDPVSVQRSERAVATARAFLEEVENKLTARRIEEPAAIYGDATIPKLDKPEDYVDLVKRRILETYPGMEFETYQRGPRQFTLKVFGDLEDMWDVQDVLGYLKADILEQHAVWIVLLPRRRHPEDN